jgi:TM2 domain-containing membrane protein YozV
MKGNENQDRRSGWTNHIMPRKNPFISIMCSILPGLGQIYNGENHRGVVFFFGVLLSFSALIFGIFGFLGFELSELFIIFLPVAVILWVGSGVDAYLRGKKMNSGEIEAREMRTLSLVLFIISAITAVLVFILLFGIVLFFAAASWMDSYSSMHEDRHLNITVNAEKIGSSITLINNGGEPSELMEYGVFVNEHPINQTLNATAGSRLVVNGTSGMDHVVVRGCWVWGACQTFLDTYV